jgi:hypothetical protein
VGNQIHFPSTGPKPGAGTAHSLLARGLSRGHSCRGDAVRASSLLSQVCVRQVSRASRKPVLRVVGVESFCLVWKSCFELSMSKTHFSVVFEPRGCRAAGVATHQPGRASCIPAPRRPGWG